LVVKFGAVDLLGHPSSDGDLGGEMHAEESGRRHSRRNKTIWRRYWGFERGLYARFGGLPHSGTTLRLVLLRHRE